MLKGSIEMFTNARLNQRGNGVEASQSLCVLYVNTQGAQVPWAKPISVYPVKETHHEDEQSFVNVDPGSVASRL